MRMEKNGNMKWLLKMSITFTAISVAIYFIFYLLFHNSEFIYEHFMVDLGFLPIEVLLVATVFDKLMGQREKEAQLERLHMIIGSFFYEVGLDLVRFFATYNPNARQIGRDLTINDSWSKADFISIKQSLNNLTLDVNNDNSHFIELRDLLYSRREYLLRLMENDNLGESESFSQLLLAIFHLSEELHLRPDLLNLKPKDFDHLSNDVLRVYSLLINQWTDYLYHMKEATPYLYSLAMRTNPFNPDASVEIS